VIDETYYVVRMDAPDLLYQADRGRWVRELRGATFMTHDDAKRASERCVACHILKVHLTAREVEP